MAKDILSRDLVRTLTTAQRNHLRIIILHELASLKNMLGLREREPRAYQSAFVPMEADNA